MKPTFILATFIAVTYNCFSQENIVIGTVADQMLKINHDDASFSSFQTAALPSGNLIARLTWSSFNQCFYTLDYNGAPGNEIAMIDLNGNYSIKGTVTIPGYTVHHIEGIALDKITGDMYVSASLNGGIPSDYWSETLLKVDTTTLEATIIGEFSQTGAVYDAEADMIAVANGFLYYQDTEGGSNPWMRWYKQDLAMTTSPVLIHEDLSGGAIGDITVKGGYLYYVKDRVLKKININTYVHTTIGPVFTPSDFGGAQMYGLDWMSEKDLGMEGEKTVLFQIYPTVSSGKITVKIDQNKIDCITIFNTQGQLVKMVAVNEPITEIDLSDLSPGMYLVNIYYPTEFYAGKVILDL